MTLINFQGFGDRLLSEIKKLAPKNMKLKVNNKTKKYIFSIMLSILFHLFSLIMGYILFYNNVNV